MTQRTNTSAADRHVLIFDGECSFCQAQVPRLHRFAPDLAIDTESYHTPGVLEKYPTLSRQQCDEAMQLVDPHGEIHSGADAVVYLLRHSSRWRWLAWVTWIPGVKLIMRWGYARIARRRYKLSKQCDSGCATR